MRTRDRERKLRRKIGEALKRIRRDEYGWCEERGEPISLRRLLARPTAMLCFEAQAAREKRQRMFGD